MQISDKEKRRAQVELLGWNKPIKFAELKVTDGKHHIRCNGEEWKRVNKYNIRSLRAYGANLQFIEMRGVIVVLKLVSATAPKKARRRLYKKVSESDVISIHAALARGESQRSIGLRFGVSQGTISYIKKHRPLKQEAS